MIKILLLISIVKMSELIHTFQDPELIELSQKYPVDQALGKRYDFWRSDQVKGVHGAEFFLNSPADNVEVDTGIPGVLLSQCASHGQWVGVDVGLTPQILQNLQRLQREGKLRHTHGLEPIVDAGIVRLQEHDGKVYVVPTQKFVEYVATKASE